MVSKLKSREKCEHPIHLLSDVWRGEQAYVNAAGIPGTSQQRNVLLIPSLNSGGRQTSEIALIGSLTTKFWFLCSLKYCGFFFFFNEKISISDPHLGVTKKIRWKMLLGDLGEWSQSDKLGKGGGKKKKLGIQQGSISKRECVKGYVHLCKGERRM